MTDINNNYGSEKINHIQNLNFGANEPSVQLNQNYEKKEIKNLNNAHAALVGRSMVKKMSKTEQPKFDPALVSSVKDSLASFKGNEKTINIANQIFEAAIQKGYSYEDAAKLQQAAVEYFKG